MLLDYFVRFCLSSCVCYVIYLLRRFVDRAERRLDWNGKEGKMQCPKSEVKIAVSCVYLAGERLTQTAD